MITHHFLRAGFLAWLGFSCSEALMGVLELSFFKSHGSLLKERKQKLVSTLMETNGPLFTQMCFYVLNTCHE